MHWVHFHLDISREEYLRYYQGVARYVAVRADDGRVIWFPANLLRQFVTGEGVHGEFRLSFDARHKVGDILRVGD